MKILILAREIAKNIDGKAYVLAIISKILAENGHKVWVITNKIKGGEFEQHPNIKLIFISSIKTGKGVATYLNLIGAFRYYFSIIKEGLSLVRRENIDIIHSTLNYSALFGSFLAFLTSKPHIVILHHLRKKNVTEKKIENGELKSRDFFLPIIQKIILKLNCSAVHTVSEFTRDNLLESGFKKPIYVIHNSIDVEEEKVLSINPFQIVHVSRIVSTKNIQVVIKAIKILKNDFPHIKLIIIGEGPYRKDLENLVKDLNVKDNVIFLGHVISQKEKNQIIAKSLALVFPSIEEGFGLVILEGFVQKKPVLSSNLRPQSDIIEDKKTGILIPPYDEKKWAESIELLIKNPKISVEIGENAKKVLDEKYTMKKMYERVINMYNDFVG